jgi:hypothetical protein
VIEQVWCSLVFDLEQPVRYNRRYKTGIETRIVDGILEFGEAFDRVPNEAVLLVLGERQKWLVGVQSMYKERCQKL